MSKGYLEAIHPVLPVKDVSMSLRFYTERLGFTIAFADDGENPKYAGVRRDNVEIHLQWHDSSEWEIGIDRPMLRLKVQNIEGLFTSFSEVDVFHEDTDLKETPWGTEEFAFYDLDKNGLTFYRDL